MCVTCGVARDRVVLNEMSKWIFCESVINPLEVERRPQHHEESRKGNLIYFLNVCSEFSMTLVVKIEQRLAAEA